MAYFSKATDKYPIAKCLIDWGNIGGNDRISYSVAACKITDDSVSLYGVLTADACIGRDAVVGNKALFQVFKRTKQEWNKDKKQQDTVNVTETESYLYDRIKGDIVDRGLEGKQFSITVNPLVAPLFFEWLARGTAQVPVEMCAELVKNNVLIGGEVADSERLSDDDLKVLDSATDNNKAKYSGAARQSESEILVTRWDFMKTQLGEYAEGINNVVELAVTINGALATEKEIMEKTIALLAVIMG